MTWASFLYVQLAGEVLGPLVLGQSFAQADRLQPFHYVPGFVSGEPIEPAPLLGLLLTGLALAGLGTAAWRRRDVNS